MEPSSHSLHRPLRILFATSEVFPLVKTGGLADVSAALPAALRILGHDVRLILPAYPQALERLGPTQEVMRLEPPALNAMARILLGQTTEGMPVYLVDAPNYFDRGGNPYTDMSGRDWGDNPDRFALFAQAVVALSHRDQGEAFFCPDLVHSNDWQTGLIAPLLASHRNRPATLFTVHNLSYQGIFDAATFQRLHLPRYLWSIDGLEFFGRMSFIKGGIHCSDFVTTVSPTYASEIRYSTLGYGLEGLFRHLGNRFEGILNGIDHDVWNPATDPYLVHPYDIERFSERFENKRALQREFGLPESHHVLLLGYIGRLIEQKGIDLILQILPGLMERQDIQMVFLGSGEAGFEEALLDAQSRHPGRVGVFAGYDEGKAHRIEAGCDSFLMPSRYEPCGLNQLYSLRYGAVPIVRRTGGLADTVVDASFNNLANHSASGFVFEFADPSGLWQAVDRAYQYWRYSTDHWRQIAITGMRQDNSWTARARKYEEIYRRVVSLQSGF
ncbi:MAG: glycogen synthase GlgA [Pseudomonadota bacterium]